MEELGWVRGDGRDVVGVGVVAVVSCGAGCVGDVRDAGFEDRVEGLEVLEGCVGKVVARGGQAVEHGLHEVFARAVGEGCEAREGVGGVGEALEGYEWWRLLGAEEEFRIGYYGWDVSIRGYRRCRGSGWALT